MGIRLNEEWSYKITSIYLDVCYDVLYVWYVGWSELYDRSNPCIHKNDDGTYQTLIWEMTWEEMYNQALEVIAELNQEITVLRAIVRVQLPIIEDNDENLQDI